MPRPGTSPVAGLMLGIKAAFAEFERRRIKERQAEGIALGRVVSFQALLSMALASPPVSYTHLTLPTIYSV